MKKAIVIVLSFIPFLAFSQKDFDYTLKFTKCTTYTLVALNKTDTAVKNSDFTVSKIGSKLTVYNGGGPVKAYKLLYRGTRNSIDMVYLCDWIDIDVAPTEPFIRIVDSGKVIVYQ
jgi:hypothetical protein